MTHREAITRGWEINHISDLTLIAYAEQCQICDLQRRFTSGPGARLDHSRVFV